jgi:hypothetical protein
MATETQGKPLKKLLPGMVGLMLVAGPVTASADACSMPATEDRCGSSRSCCCTRPSTPSNCATVCSPDDHAGVARLDGHPFRITRATLRKPLASLDAFPVLCRVAPGQGDQAASCVAANARGSPAPLAKRYLRLCTLRL